MASRLIATALLCLSLALPGTAALADRAVVVGVNIYPHTGNNLKGARPDAEHFRNFLISRMGLAPSDITLLVDRQATRASVLEAIKRDLINGTKPGDRVFLYFSGHGMRLTDRDSDERTDGKDEALVLSDVGSPTIGVILDDEIGHLFSLIPGRRVMVLVDACHSGTITRGTGEDDALARFLRAEDVFPNGIPASLDVTTAPAAEATRGMNTRTFAPGQGHMSVWSAASENQVAFEVGGQGLFTHAFTTGLGERKADSNGNGIVSNAELLAYTRAASANFCRLSRGCQEANRGSLTPSSAAASKTTQSSPRSPRPLNRCRNLPRSHNRLRSKTR